jgi:hypothetical protein
VAKGIFNPFQKPGAPKKSFVGATDPKNPRDTEYQDEPPKSTIRLDGDSYVLQFNDIELEDLNKRLETLLQEVSREHAPALTDAGVMFVPKPNIPELSEGQLRLETPRGYVVVYAGENGKEVDCFRRLAYALYGLPIKDILDRHNAKVYKRG